ncbi:hypothetical protein B0H17DRAFT_1202567 [Mycena rosella]|uniref:Uncharacterized protein n=1 Tax=Mycena rosella TaxID=1033263 RepID=A0AAD7GI11_MYCRO|nr:hypothetical protein B0H17DRAFT_1202567 [Mycena rosella]
MSEPVLHWEPAVGNKPTWKIVDPFGRNGPGSIKPMTLAELAMYELSWTLRRKPEWQRKAADPEIRGKWRREALEQVAAAGSDGATRKNGGLLSEKMIDYVLAELMDTLRLRTVRRESSAAASTRYGTRSDSFPAQRLKSAVSVLEDVPKDRNDWHPGSNGQVLDLVHPSLYCVVTAAPTPQARALNANWKSGPLRIFPGCPPTVDDKHGCVELASPYINNLHTVLRQPLYRAIKEVLTGFIPMFERVLGDANRSKFSNGDRLGKISCISGPDGNYDVGPEEGPDEYEFLEQCYNSLPKVMPEAGLANIHLTPEQPEYAGGSWHVEGMVNESIAASGIYYHDEENVTESQLAFRVAVMEPDYHGQNDDHCTRLLYGLDNQSDTTQEIGAMVIKAGRTLSWPNLFQHCVSPFKLADPSKPGHRKILAIFLVNPTADAVVSATDVAPQQAEWAAEAFEDACAASTSVLGDFPQELRDLVKEYFPATVMTREEAEEYRLELMKERTAFVGEHTRTQYGQNFNMCEH